MKRVFQVVLVLSLLVATGIGAKVYIDSTSKTVTPVRRGSETAALGQELEAHNLQAPQGIFQQGDSLMATISGKTVLFSIEKDFGTQVRALQLVLTHLTMGGEKEAVKEIDLRFQKVVLRK